VFGLYNRNFISRNFLITQPKNPQHKSIQGRRKNHCRKLEIIETAENSYLKFFPRQNRRIPTKLNKIISLIN
jgi:hypothetical protein